MGSCLVMNNTLSTYKKILFIKLFGIYLLANFSLPLVEGIHFLLHLGDNTELHAYSAHHKIHSHTTLNIIGQFITDQDFKHTSTTTESIAKIKKNIQYCELETIVKFAPILKSTQDFIFISNYNTTPFLSLIAPPPKSKYLL